MRTTIVKNDRGWFTILDDTMIGTLGNPKTVTVKIVGYRIVITPEGKSKIYTYGNGDRIIFLTSIMEDFDKDTSFSVDVKLSHNKVTFIIS